MTVEIIFERGKTPFEYFIMFLQSWKLRRSGLSFQEVFSHVAIKLNDDVYQTHPRHGVIHSKYEEGGHPERREIIDITELFSEFQQSVIWNQLHDYNQSINKYDKAGAFLSGIYMITGLWLGRKNRKNFYCSSLIAKVLDMKNWYKSDMLDTMIFAKNMLTLKKIRGEADL